MEYTKTQRLLGAVLFAGITITAGLVTVSLYDKRFSRIDHISTGLNYAKFYWAYTEYFASVAYWWTFVKNLYWIEVGAWVIGLLAAWFVASSGFFFLWTRTTLVQRTWAHGDRTMEAYLEARRNPVEVASMIPEIEKAAVEQVPSLNAKEEVAVVDKVRILGETIEKAGGVSALARVGGFNRTQVYAWADGSKPIPDDAWKAIQSYHQGQVTGQVTVRKPEVTAGDTQSQVIEIPKVTLSVAAWDDYLKKVNALSLKAE